MNTRPTDVLFDVEVSDHADIEHETESLVSDEALERLARAIQIRGDIRRLEADIGNKRAELIALLDRVPRG